MYHAILITSPPLMTKLINNYRAHFPNSLKNVIVSYDCIGKHGLVIEKGRNEELQALFYSIQGGIWDICNLKSMCIDCETERMFQLGGGSV